MPHNVISHNTGTSHVPPKPQNPKTPKPREQICRNQPVSINKNKIRVDQFQLRKQNKMKVQNSGTNKARRNGPKTKNQIKNGGININSQSQNGSPTGPYSKYLQTQISAQYQNPFSSSAQTSPTPPPILFALSKESTPIRLPQAQKRPQMNQPIVNPTQNESQQNKGTASSLERKRKQRSGERTKPPRNTSSKTMQNPQNGALNRINPQKSTSSQDPLTNIMLLPPPIQQQVQGGSFVTTSNGNDLGGGPVPLSTEQNSSDKYVALNSTNPPNTGLNINGSSTLMNNSSSGINKNFNQLVHQKYPLNHNDSSQQLQQVAMGDSSYLVDLGGSAIVSSQRERQRSDSPLLSKMSSNPVSNNTGGGALFTNLRHQFENQMQMVGAVSPERLNLREKRQDEMNNQQYTPENGAIFSNSNNLSSISHGNLPQWQPNYNNLAQTSNLQSNQIYGGQSPENITQKVGSQTNQGSGNGAGAPSMEFLTLKGISDNLENKLDFMQGEIRRLIEASPDSRLRINRQKSTSTTPMGLYTNQDTSMTNNDMQVTTLNGETSQSQSPTSAQRRKEILDNFRVVARDSETQTEVDDATRHFVEEIHELKFQNFKLNEQIREIERKNRNQNQMCSEKLKTYEDHLMVLKNDNARLLESVKLRKDQIAQNVQKQILSKDNLIKELTEKLRESTRVIQQVKANYNGLKEENSILQKDRKSEKMVQQEKLKVQQTIKNLEKQFEAKLAQAQESAAKGASQKVEQELRQEILNLKNQAAQNEERHKKELLVAKDQGEESYRQMQSDFEKNTQQNSMMAKMQEKMLQQLKDKISALEQESKEKSSEIIKIEKENLEKVAKLSNQVNNIASEKESMQKSFQENQQKAISEVSLESQSKFMKVNLENQELKKTMKDLIKKIEQDEKKSNQKVQALQSEIDSLTKMHKKKVDQLQETQSESQKNLLAQIEEEKDATETFVHELDKKERIIEELKTEMGNLQAQYDKFRQETEDKSSQSNKMLSSVQEQLKASLDSTLKEAADEKANFKNQIQKLNEENLKQNQYVTEELKKIKDAHIKDKSELETVKTQKKEMSLKMAKAAKENLVKNTKDQKALKQAQNEAGEFKQKLEAQVLISQQLQEQIELTKQSQDSSEQNSSQLLQQIAEKNAQIQNLELSTRQANEKFEQQISDLQKQKNSLQTQIEESKQNFQITLTSLQQEIESQKSAKGEEVKVLTEQLASFRQDSDSEMQLIKQDLATKTKELENKLQNIVELEKLIEQIQKGHQEGEGQICEIKKQLAKAESDLRDEQTKNETSVDKVRNSMKEKLEEKQELIADIQSQFDESRQRFETTLSSLQSELEIAKASQNQHSDSLTRTELEQQRKQNAQLVADMLEMEKDQDDMEQQIKDLKEEIQLTEKDLKDGENELGSLQKQLAEAQDKLLQAQSFSQSQIEQLKEDMSLQLDAKSAIINELTAQLKDKTDQLGKVQAEKESIGSQSLAASAEQSQQIKSLQNQLEVEKSKGEKSVSLVRLELESQILAQKQAFEQLQKQIDSQMSSESEKGNKIRLLETELDSCKKGMEAQKKDQEREIDEITESSLQQISELEDQIEKQEESQKSLQNKIDELEKGKQILEKSKKDAENELQEMEKEYKDQCAAQLEDSREQFDAEISQLKEKLRDAQMKIQQEGKTQDEVSQLQRQITDKDDGTAVILIKFQDQLAQKDKNLTEIQSKNKSLKTEITSLQEQAAKQLKSHAVQIAKLNAKLNKQETMAQKYFGVTEEITSLKSQLLLKDNEISKLKLANNSSSHQSGATTNTTASASQENSSSSKKKRPPSPDKDLMDFFGGGQTSSAAKSDEDQMSVGAMEEEIEILNQKCDEYEADLKFLEEENEELKRRLTETQPSPKSDSGLVEELKKKEQLLQVKDSEIGAMRDQIKKYKETLNNEDLSREVSELSKQLAFTDQEKQVKEMTISQLRQDLEGKDAQIKTLKAQSESLTKSLSTLMAQMNP